MQIKTTENLKIQAMHVLTSVQDSLKGIVADDIKITEEKSGQVRVTATLARKQGKPLSVRSFAGKGWVTATKGEGMWYGCHVLIRDASPSVTIEILTFI